MSETLDPNDVVAHTVKVLEEIESATEYQTCKNCKQVTHPAYLARYGGYCLDCDNAGVPEKDERIATLTLELDRATQREQGLRAALELDHAIAEAAIKLLRRSIVDAVPNVNGNKGYHAEISTDMEMWQEFFNSIPRDRLGKTKVDAALAK